MKSEKPLPKNIDDYISGFRPEIRLLLEDIRQTISNAAPEATESISYQMPTFRLNGNLIHFAAFKNHIGLYPAPTGVEAAYGVYALARAFYNINSIKRNIRLVEKF